MNNLKSYIKDNLRKGINLESIKKALHSAGYMREDIEKAVNGLYKEQITDIAKYINKEMKHGLRPSSIRNYLIASGHPESQVDDAVKKILSAKKTLLRKKKIEKAREQFKEIKKNIYSKVYRNIILRVYDIWGSLKPWQRGAYIPTLILFTILFFWEITMMISSIILSGSLNCFSFGIVVQCSFFESLLFYVLLMLALIVIFCLPVFGLGALAGYLIGRLK